MSKNHITKFLCQCGTENEPHWRGDEISQIALLVADCKCGKSISVRIPSEIVNSGPAWDRHINQLALEAFAKTAAEEIRAAQNRIKNM